MTAIEIGRRERKKEETKERILQSAFELFRKQGVEATTVEQICERADVAKGTFFNYFPRKEAVFGYLSETWVSEAEETIREILEKSGPAWSKIREVFVGFAAFYEEDREVSRHMAEEWTRSMHDPENDTCCRWDDLGEHVVRRLQENGELRRDIDPARVHHVFADVYHGTIMMWLESPKPPFSLRDELRKRLTLVLEGFGPQKPPGRGARGSRGSRGSRASEES